MDELELEDSDKSYYGDSDMEDDRAVPGGSDIDVNTAVPVVPKSSGKFSDETLAVLKSLYKKGMIGWGRSHADEIKAAVATTGLQLNQVKVYYLVLVLLLFYLYNIVELDQA